MDSTEYNILREEDSSLVKTFKAATSGFVAGSLWGMIVATWNDVPRVERSVALPGLIRTGKMMAKQGLTFAAIGGIYIGVEQIAEKLRNKKDYVNGTVGGFVSGATVFGLRGGSVSTAVRAGAALAVTSFLIDIGGQKTRHDVGKEYAAYTTKKRESAVTE